MIHIYTESMQPATRYADRTFERPMWFRNKARAVRRCYGCGRRRWAKNLRVQVFYDGHRFWCDGGCK